MPFCKVEVSFKGCMTETIYYCIEDVVALISYSL